MTETAAPAWARGFPIEELRAVADLYRVFDKPYVLGAFSAVKENTIAAWLDSSELVAWTERGDGSRPGVSNEVYAAARVSWASVATPVRDFTGEVRARIAPGDVVIRHPASITYRGRVALGELVSGARPLTSGARVWLEGWQEDEAIRTLAETAGLEHVATKIKASSELVSVWGPPDTAHTVPHLADVATLARLPYRLDELVEPAAAEVAGMAGWADHYSSYNAKHAWSALSLRGYTEPGTSPDPAQIVKPAEMSKAWRAEHPDWQDWRVEWTPLLDRLPAVHALVAAIGGLLDVEFQRVRLMRLQPGGGELTRHSDITDHEAGTAPGKLARLHVPLITNPQVLFRQWLLDGRQVEANMGPGTMWYLDTRKPHRAGNYGETERVHLVADAVVGPRLRATIARSPSAELAVEP